MLSFHTEFGESSDMIYVSFYFLPTISTVVTKKKGPVKYLL